MKDISKMSESEVRQELKAWREFGADVFRRLTVSRYQERQVIEGLDRFELGLTKTYAEALTDATD